ncbi:MAG TPA: NAD(P)-binding protein [Gaiellaceae bacterium]
MRTESHYDRDESGGIAVLGGGPAGLTAAYVLALRGVPGTVYEADGTVGGIAKTVEFNGYRFDLGGHPVVVREGPPDPGERVAVDDDVGVDEHEHISPGPIRALVPRGRRPRGGRPVDDDHLVRGLGGRLDRGETRGERRRRVRCGHDRAQAGHAPILHGIYVAPMQCGLQGGHGRTGLQGPFRAGTG